MIGAQSNDPNEKGGALLTGIISVLECFNGEGTSLGIIRNRLRSFDREQIKTGIEHLVKTGAVIERSYKDSRNREKIKYVKK